MEWNRDEWRCGWNGMELNGDGMELWNGMEL